MTRILRSEIRKLATLKTPVLLIGAAITIEFLGLIAQMTDGSAELPGRVDDLGFFTWKPVLIATFLVGIWWVTDEYRHGLVGPGFLVTPRRARVLGAKLAVLASAGALVTLVAESVFLTVALHWIGTKGVTIAIPAGDIVGEVARSAVAASLWAALGIAMGTIVRSQAAALTGGLIWVLVAEDVAGLFVKAGLGYLPVHASDAFVRPLGEGSLSVPVGGIVFAAYALVAAAAAVGLIRQRDVS